MKILTTEELRKRLETGPLALFDVRGDVEYEEGHIESAKTAPLGSLVFRVRAVMNPETQVVVYSNSSECNLAAEAGERLESLGMKNIYIYKDGVEGWLKSGFSLVPSPHAREHARGPVIDCRPIVVDRERAYGGAFKGKPSETESAGG